MKTDLRVIDDAKEYGGDIKGSVVVIDGINLEALKRKWQKEVLLGVLEEVGYADDGNCDLMIAGVLKSFTVLAANTDDEAEVVKLYRIKEIKSCQTVKITTTK